MTVTVAWPVGKQRGDNHEPQFRPTGSNRLEGKETTIARLVYQAYTLMDPAWNASLALGRITEGTYQKRIDTALESLTGALQKVLYEAHVAEMEEMAGRIRESINRDLRRIGSPVRLVATGATRKAANVYLEWAGKLATTFDAALPGSTSLVYAQFRTGQIVTYMGTEQVGMIRDQIARAFTQIRQWGGGRTTTGLTPQQVASNLFSLLAATGVEGMELSAEEVAAYRSAYTNGLFPSWANAVNNYGDQMAAQLAPHETIDDPTRTDDELAELAEKLRDLLDKRTQRYGDKLRRARSRMIARTEIAKVQNAAMQATIDSAYSDGLVGNQAEKVWVTGPFDVCDICQPLSGRRVPYNGYFQWKNGSGPHGPAHPNCRCIIRMVPNTSRAPKHTGTGTPEDPFRYTFADGWEAPITPVRGAPSAPDVRVPAVPLPGQTMPGTAGHLAALASSPAGGFTYNQKSGKMEGSGMAVAIDALAERKFTLEEWAANGPQAVLDYMDEMESQLAAPNVHVGAWRGERDDQEFIFLDLSAVVDTAEEAADLARMHTQDAFWDLGNDIGYNRRDDNRYYSTDDPKEIGKRMAKQGNVYFISPRDARDPQALRQFVDAVAGSDLVVVPEVSKSNADPDEEVEGGEPIVGDIGP